MFKRLLTIERLVLGYVVVMGLIFAFYVPPFQKPDEVTHFYNAAVLANGAKNSMQKRLYDLPFRVMAYEIAYRPNVKFLPRLVAEKGVDKSLLVKQEVTLVSGIRWLGYAPSALGIMIGKPFSLPIISFFLARLMGLIFFVVSIVWCLNFIPKAYGGIIYAYAVLPMVLHQVTSVNYDVVPLILSPVILVLFIRILSREKTSVWVYVAFMVSLVLLQLAKPGYYLFSILILIVLIEKGKKVVGRYWWLAIVVLELVLVFLVLMMIDKVAIPFLKGYEQFAILQQDPGYLLKVLPETFRKMGAFYWESLWGCFGWLDYKYELKDYLFVFGLVLYFLFNVFRKVKKVVISKLNLLFLFMFWVGQAILIVFLFYISWSPVGSLVSVGTQGRYFLVLFPFVIFSLIQLFLILGKNGLKYLLSGLVLLVVAINTASLIYTRYYNFSGSIEKNDYLKIRADNYFDTPAELRQEKFYRVDEKFSHDFGLEDSKGKLAGFEFVFVSKGLPVDVPYRYYLKDKDCQKTFYQGFLDQSFLKKEGVYREQFTFVKNFEVDELCLVLEPAFKDVKNNFLSVVEYDGEILFRLLKPRKYVMEELDFEPDFGNLGEIDRQKKFFQTFTANQNNLVGIGVLVDSYGIKRDISSYQLALYDKSCTNLVNLVDFAKKDVLHGYFADVFFEPLAVSGGEKYCFTVLSVDDEPRHPITIPFAKIFDNHTARGWHEQGNLSINGNILQRDLVFRLWYKN